MVLFTNEATAVDAFAAAARVALIAPLVMLVTVAIKPPTPLLLAFVAPSNALPTEEVMPPAASRVRLNAPPTFAPAFSTADTVLLTTPANVLAAFCTALVRASKGFWLTTGPVQNSRQRQQLFEHQAKSERVPCDCSSTGGVDPAMLAACMLLCMAGARSIGIIWAG